MELENVSLSTEILGPFVNILTADDKYFLRNSENLRQPTQRHLSIKVKPFSDFSLSRTLLNS